jgi:sulfopropanediol 3-dehydrogenase
MPTRTLKAATVTPTTGESEARARVAELLAGLEAGGEAEALRLAAEFDGWSGDPVVPPEAFARAEASLPQQVKDDLAFAHDRIRRFAEAQRASMHEVRCELAPGVTTGHRLVPLQTAGCYVPGGRYAHAASALMSVTPARVAGVDRVVATSPPRDGGVHPAVLYALQLAGVDTVAALAFGLFTGAPADIVVGPGNRWVAEAKRHLYGRCGIDLFAGPSEVLILADETADPETVAVDLVGQAEHGPTSPAVLVTTHEPLARAVLARAPELAAALPDGNAAPEAWADCGEVILCDTREEAAAASDAWAPEHLQVMAADLDWWLGRLRNYGSLFLGEETTVSYGDKASGPNHILPTRGAARYTGGLGVHKFLKTLTWQRMTPAATEGLAQATARISRLEGMEGHARSADHRVRWYLQEQGS